MFRHACGFQLANQGTRHAHPCKRTSAIATFSIPCATPSCRRRASRTSGVTEHCERNDLQAQGHREGIGALERAQSDVVVDMASAPNSTVGDRPTSITSASAYIVAWAKVPYKLDGVYFHARRIARSSALRTKGGFIALASPLLPAKEDCRRAGLSPNYSQFSCFKEFCS